ncbi:glycerol-3-phosphate dehydrogenase/oxidase [Alkalibacterium iburiense]|uniref:Alpha-glycerophosphate oxidase n=1 Tax=Alkalibacterium iburiense TaxID=290589 RepID=A0ABN0X910_9LACT
MAFSAQTRKENINKLKNEELDLLVIGGGITGAGIALHGAARGSQVGLVEMQDFAGGTSSRSTKLVHGGLRYLKQFDVELVADVAKERTVIGKNAPHVVQPSYMLMPVYDEPGASFNEFSAKVVLHLYDYLAEVDEEWTHYMVDKESTLEEEPALKKDGLVSGGFYLDYTNDDARLTIEIIKKAHELGAVLTNYVKAVDFLYDETNQLIGIKALDILTEETFDIHAKVIVNASGPWSDEVRKQTAGETEQKMYPTKGVHFVVDRDKLPVNRTIYTDTGQEDNRMIFIIPRGNKTYFGTTDTPFEGPYEDPEVTEEDIEYLLKAVNHRFDKVNLTREDIESSWSGLRPLIQDENNDDPSGISRGHDVFVESDGLVTIAGGKLTDYRRMAEDVFKTIDEEWEKKSLSFEPVDTKTIPLSGGDIGDLSDFSAFIQSKREEGLSIGLSEKEADALADWYGSNVDQLYALADKAKTFDMPLSDALQLAYALEHEMVMTPEDFFARRTDSLLFDIQKMIDLKEKVLDIFAKERDWSEEDSRYWKEKIDERIKETSLSHFK